MSVNNAIIPKSHELKLLGFGEHVNPVKDPKQIEQAHRIYKIALYVLFAVIAVAAIALSVAFPLFPIVAIPFVIGASALLAVSAAFVAKAYLSYVAKKDAYVGITNDFKVAHEPTALGRNDQCDIMPCADGVVTFEWKKKLIESAQHNIVLSGSYCGGNSFDEILDLMRQQLNKKPNLKILVLNAAKFSNKSNKARVAAMIRDYPNRFQMALSPDVWMLNPSLKRSTNHAKILSIDYGSYFIIGGSSLEDKYAYTRGNGEPDVKPMIPIKGLLSKIVASSFRDQDFVFGNNTQNGLGKRVYLEALKLVWRWNSLKQAGSGWVHDNLHDLTANNSVIGRLLQEQVDGKDNVNPPPATVIPDFKPISTKANTKIFCMGPEHIENPYEAELIKQFEDAKIRIVINHLYFHPTEKVMNALVNAANRGVKIFIETNGYNCDSSPLSHKLFGLRNRYNAATLLKRVEPKYKMNVDVREYNVPSVTLHNKIVVVDDFLIAGSGNIGYKSLVTMSDHEIICVINDKALADDAVQKTLLDGKPAYSRKMRNPEKITFGASFASAIHRSLAALIG